MNVTEYFETGDKNYIKWDSKFELGIPTIDEQHKNLVQLCNNFYQEILQQSNKPAFECSFSNTLHECVEYVKTHFRDEETLMKACGYEGFAEHKKRHDEFIETVLQTSRSVQNENNIKSALKFVKFLYDWVLSHIAHEDKLYAKSILEYYRKRKTAGQQ